MFQSIWTFFSTFWRQIYNSTCALRQIDWAIDDEKNLQVLNITKRIFITNEIIFILFRSDSIFVEFNGQKEFKYLLKCLTKAETRLQFSHFFVDNLILIIIINTTLPLTHNHRSVVSCGFRYQEIEMNISKSDARVATLNTNKSRKEIQRIFFREYSHRKDDVVLMLLGIQWYPKQKKWLKTKDQQYFCASMKKPFIIDNME